MPDERARITVAQVVQLLFVMAILAALAPVYFTSLDANADLIGTGPGLLLRALVPLMVIAIMHWIWSGATGGAT